MGEASEGILANLCQRSFLSFWSYPRPHTNEGFSKRRQGDELCDLLVIFGDDVLIFSDKDRSYTNHVVARVNWDRWYRKAVKGSILQIAGAEKWIRESPDDLFTDKSCAVKLDVKIPTGDRLRVHRICIVLGAKEACAAEHEDDPLGALMIRGGGQSPIESGREMFCVGEEVSPTGGFVHVFDERALEVLMVELNTARDFCDYLLCKEDAMTRHYVIAGGEEDLLAHYLTNGQSLVPPQGRYDLLDFGFGTYRDLVQDPRYKAAKCADETSFAWDMLIEDLTLSWRTGNLDAPPPPADFEVVLRKMASFDRLSRRRLGTILKDSLFDGRARTVSDGPIAVCVVVLRPPDGLTKKQLNEMRANASFRYACMARIRDPEVREAIIFVASRKGVDRLSPQVNWIGLPDWNELIEEDTLAFMRKHNFSTNSDRYKDLLYPNDLG